MARPAEPKPGTSPFARFQQLAKKLVAAPKEKVSKDDSKTSES